MQLNSETNEVGRERRAVPRFVKKDKIECISINTEKCFHLFEGSNISVRGIGFISPIEFKENDFLEIVVYFDKSISMLLLLRVVRSDSYNEKFFVGGEFIGMLSYNYKILESVLEGSLDQC
jgi:hypothetical protein